MSLALYVCQATKDELAPVRKQCPDKSRKAGRPRCGFSPKYSVGLTEFRLHTKFISQAQRDWDFRKVTCIGTCYIYIIELANLSYDSPEIPHDGRRIPELGLRKGI